MMNRGLELNQFMSDSIIPVTSLPISLTNLIDNFCKKHTALQKLYLALEPQGADIRFVAFLDTDNSILDEAFKTSVIEQMKLDTPIVFDNRVAVQIGRAHV